jgi:hypothetical protein
MKPNILFTNRNKVPREVILIRYVHSVPFDLSPPSPRPGVATIHCAHGGFVALSIAVFCILVMA